MRTGISFTVSPTDRRPLEALVRDRNAPQKHVWRAAIVLLTADGVGTNEIMRRTGKSKTCVWRWQERFMRRKASTACCATRRGRRASRRSAAEVAERVVALTLADPPGETTHWTADMMAKAAGISASAVQAHLEGAWPRSRIAAASSSSPTIPKFVDKLRDVVGLYVDPPAHAIVLSVDEKSQIQALDRTQPGLPMKKGRPAP